MLRKAPKPKQMTTVGLLRGVDRQRVTGAVVAHYWTGYWRNTPLLTWPRGRVTPISSNQRQRQSVNTEQHTAGYFSSSCQQPSTITTTNIISPTSTADMKKRSMTDNVLEGGTSDVTELDDVNSITNNKKLVLEHGHSTTPNHLTDLLASVTVLSSQRVATSGTSDNKVSGIDVKAHAAEAANSNVEAVSNSQLMTASASQGEMMMTTDELTDDAGSSSDVRQVVHAATSALNDARDTGETMNDAVEMMSGSSNEAMKYAATTGALNDAMQVSANSLETSTSLNSDLMADNRWKNGTCQSATDNDEDSTSDESAVGRMTNTGGDGSATTPAVNASSTRTDSLPVTTTHSLNESGRARSVMSSERESSSLTEGAMSTISSRDDAFSLWPRAVLLDSVNSTDNDSAISSNHCTLSCKIIGISY